MKRNLIIFALIIALFMALAPNVSSIKGASNEWVPLNDGFPALDIIDLAVEPSNSQVMYAVTNGFGVYKTTDGGSNWIQINNGIEESDIFCIFIDPLKPQVAYAGSYGIFKSTNRGGEWTSLNIQLSGKVNCIRTDPSNSNIIYIGTEEEGIFKSIDGGLNWVQISQGLRDYDYVSFPHINAIFLDFSNHSILYACADDGIYKSLDTGSNWVKINNGLAQTVKIVIHDMYGNPIEGTGQVIPAILSASINNSSPSNIYLGTNMGIFVTENGGESWAKLSGLEDVLVLRIVASSNLDRIVIGTDKGLFISKDYAKTWQKLGQGSIEKQINGLFVDFSEPIQICAATPAGIFKSKDGGNSFLPLNKGLVHVNISHIISGGDEKVLFAAALSDGLYKSSNFGENWNLIAKGLENLSVISAAVDPNNNQVVLAGTDDGIYISKDSGETFDPSSKRLEGNEVYSIVFLTSQVILAGTTQGIYRSEDGGATWKPSNAGITEDNYFSVVSLAFNVKNPETIYAGTADKGVFKSQDGGNSWTSINQSLDSPLPHINVIIVDPLNSSIVYIGSDGAGLLKSENGGTTWNKIDKTPSPWVRDLLINPINTKNIYAEFYPNGIFASYDGGLTWSDINFGLPSKDISSLFHKNNYLFATANTGVYKLVASYVITASAGTNGTLYPSGTTSYNYGASQIFTITPNSGYKISNVKVDGASVGAVSSFTFTNITADHTINATFEKQISTTIIVLQIGIYGEWH